MAYRKKKNKIIFIVGPTATNKSAAAVHLAKRINAEIISCDSMQIYKGMKVISSQPPAALRKKIAHYLIGVVSPAREYNVACYRREAFEKIRKVLKKDKTPLFVGGTGLYMSILVDGIFELEAKDGSLRRKLYAQAQKYGRQYLYKRLKGVDPEAAKKIHPHDQKRMIRALEVFISTGRPISQLQKQRKGLKGEYGIIILGLNMRRQKLYQKIGERVEKMFSQGLVPEVKRLLKLKLSKTAASAIGIKELKGYFVSFYDLTRAKDLIKRNTRRYAKRQLTWFRKDKRIKWINLSGKENPRQIADKLWKKLS